MIEFFKSDFVRCNPSVGVCAEEGKGCPWRWPLSVGPGGESRSLRGGRGGKRTETPRP